MIFFLIITSFFKYGIFLIKGIFLMNTEIEVVNSNNNPALNAIFLLNEFNFFF